MRNAVAIALVTVAFASPAFGADARFKAMLKTLDPEIRLEQVCDAEAMRRIGRDRNAYRPDRAMIGAVSRPLVHGDTIEGTGGAFRSRGKWYGFSFVCEATPDRLSVRAFEYKVGTAIPEEKWSSYGLYH